ncbi:Protocadherin beta-7, partial [Bienertia sinuspersici]
GDNGDVVDCVDIYKQPAFNHPLLKDHKLQINPSSALYQNNSGPDFIQTWHKNGKCSEGTVPIRRRQLQDSDTSMQGPHHEASLHCSIFKTYQLNKCNLFIYMDVKLQYAGIISWPPAGQKYYGGGGHLSVWNPAVSRTRDLSASTLIVSLSVAEAAFMIAGWIDRPTGNWWLYVKDNPIGYWPAALFTGFPEEAERLKWGGQIYDSIGGAQHTDTDMGNGLFPETNQASLVCSLKYVDSGFTLRTPLRSSLRTLVTNPLCYNAELLPGSDPANGVCFMFGGSGRNINCQ